MTGREMKRGRSEGYPVRSGLLAFRGWKRRSDLALRHVRRVDGNITLEKLRDDSYEIDLKKRSL
jgi:hypothetical protein